jgi:putative oxidoreductase
MEAAALIRLTAGLILAGSSGAKIFRPRAFIESVRRYELLPASLAGPGAVVVIASEAVVAFGLLSGLLVRTALLGAAGLFLMFAAVLALTLLRDREVDCGCLGDLVELRLDWWSVVTNLAIAGLALAASTRPALGVPMPGERAPSGAMFVLWATAALLAAVYWLAAYARSVTRFVEGELAKGAQA